MRFGPILRAPPSSFLGKEPDIAARNVSPTYDGDHSAGRFGGSARNDNRAAERPGFRGFRGFKEQEKVLKFDRPLAGRFLGLTGLWPEGCGIAFGYEYIVCVAYYPYRLPLVILSDSEGSRYLQHMRQNH